MVSLRVLFFLLISVSCYSQKLIQLQLNGISGNNFWRTTGNANTDTSNFLGTTDAKDLVIKTNNTEAMRIDTNGNVGIGTAMPIMKLDLNGNLFVSQYGIVPSTSFILSFDTAASVMQCAHPYDEGVGSASMNKQINILPSYIEIKYFETGFGYSKCVPKIIFDSTGINMYSLSATGYPFVADTSGFIKLDSAGNVGIGRYSFNPTAKLHVNGTTRLEGTPQSLTSDSLLTIDDAGNVAWRTPYYYGTDTLTNGVDTVWTSDITSNSMIQLTSNGLNGSIQAGILDVTEISDGNYFIVNSLKTNTTIEADDQRKYYWFFIRKP